MPEHGAQFAGALRAPEEHAVQVLDRLPRHAVGLAGTNLIRARAVLHLGDHVCEHDGPHRAERERQVEFEAAAFGASLLETAWPSRNMRNASSPRLRSASS